MSLKCRVFKGQNMIEFASISVVVLFVSLAGIFYFGGALADLFSENNANTLYNSTNRTALDPDE